MQPQPGQPNPLIQYGIFAVIFLVVFALRARRTNRMRPLKLNQLWIVPAIYAVVVIAAFIAQPPSALGWGVALVGLLVGAGLGWQRGKFTSIHVDPDTNELRQKSSIAGLAFIFVLVLARQAMRAGMGHAGLNPAVLVDGLMALALGTFVAMRVEMYLRAKRVMLAHRATTFS